MSEYAPLQHEAQNSPEIPRVERVEHRTKASEKQAETRQAASKSLEAIRQQIEQVQTITQELPAANKAEHQQAVDTPTFVTRNLKIMAQKRLLKKVRQQLPAGERAFSKVLHQPLVDAASEVTGKTIARPVGLLVGGICALIGSSALLYIDKHYGYNYNFLLWLLCFVGGLVFGLVLEAIIRLTAKLRT